MPGIERFEDYQEFDPCPSEEKCVQVGWPHDHQAGMLEARVMANYLDRILRDKGFENTRITVVSVAHDFGSYPEIRVYGHADLLIAADDNWPLHWDAQAKEMLLPMFRRAFGCSYEEFIETKGVCVHEKTDT
jgi:hypothetical protein